MGYPQNIKVTVDAIVFAYQGQDLEILLIQRKSDPFKGKWALPGGFVEDDEPLDTAVSRELEEETGIQTTDLFQFYTFGQPDRDPRGRAISVAYYTEVDKTEVHPKAASDAAETQWFSMNRLPELAFDHADILAKVKQVFLNS
ncbi:NUDIX hydrolase [Catalinimonas niigatensis]|uniref:NUDIX hydrolase n=1 Tax=Catalinimonas niigatensis TaxID=1397264 RepID=UPI002666719A|nr:NUDIX hydrolase [Catalinimonas niigatensis]WPP48051.1 NUDIX hydrolase [Catalinimonas niigatensis]